MNPERQLETLREEVLRFIDEVDETFHHPDNFCNKYSQFVEILHQFHGNLTSGEALTRKLIKLFQGHENLICSYKKFVTNATINQKRVEFFNKLQAIDTNTSNKIKVVLMGKKQGTLTKAETYIKICALLFGHIDIFLLYESLSFDGSEGCRSTIMSLRDQAKVKCLADVTAKLENYRSTIQAIEHEPSIEALSDMNLRCSAEMYCSDEEGIKKRMNDLAKHWRKDPNHLRKGVVPRMAMKVRGIEENIKSWDNYFDQIYAHPL